MKYTQYKALDIADYVVFKATEFGNAISHLQLQKIMYLILGEVHKQKNFDIFKEDFKVWVCGPIIQEVYDEYCCYGGSAIYAFNSNFADIKDLDVKKIVDEIIKDKSIFRACELAAKTNKSGGAWHSIYNNGNGMRYTILREQIYKDFSEN